MAKDKQQAGGGDAAPEGEKKTPFAVLAGVVVLMSAVAVGAGYGIAGVINQALDNTGAPVAGSVVADVGAPNAANRDGGHGRRGDRPVAVLEPIIVTLPDNDNTWLRLELALVMDPDSALPSEYERATIASDLSGFLRTLELGKVFQPSGYLHLREDLLDRARLASGAAVSDVMIISLVAE